MYTHACTGSRKTQTNPAPEEDLDMLSHVPVYFRAVRAVLSSMLLLALAARHAPALLARVRVREAGIHPHDAPVTDDVPHAVVHAAPAHIWV